MPKFTTQQWRDPRRNEHVYYADAASTRQAAADLATLTRNVQKIAQAEARITATVQQLRAAGASWALIADALGVTKQAAAKRYSADRLI